ncbi:MAG: DUF72 domain-containing protein, partial [Phycisphaerales bacterium]|nr:DUF72 domain-containing protein [Phycisphaerales bacterium]
PADFRFAVKAPRDVTHGPTPEGALANAQGPERGHFENPRTLEVMQRLLENVSALEERLGPVLMQFPPGFDDRFRAELTGFLDRLGPGVERARAGGAPNLRLALELRHQSWAGAGTASMLAARGMALVYGDHTPRQETDRAGVARVMPPPPLTATADVLYLRLLGRHGQFRLRTREQADVSARLAWWRGQVAAACAARRVETVYAFFDNDFAGFAPASASRFAALVGARQPVLAEVKPLREPTLFDV